MKEFSHIAGTFLIQADGSFLNGAGIESGDDSNTTTVPKTMRVLGGELPYVSAQAWRRWLRNTAIEEYGWKASELRAIDFNPKGNTNKIAGELDPVLCPEDDIFGYMRSIEKDVEKKLRDAEKELDKLKKNDSADDTQIANLKNKISFYRSVVDYEENYKDKVKALIRTSPLMTSILTAVTRKDSKTLPISTDKGFVHLKEGTPQPYETKFYSVNMQGFFCLDYNRLGVFSNIGDRVELDQLKIPDLLKSSLITEEGEKGKKIYKIANLEEARKKRTAELLGALSVLRGGAKQAAFGTELSPSFIIIAAMNCGNAIFNHLFYEEKTLIFKTDTFLEIISDFKDRIIGNIYIGLRKGYIHNEDEIYKFGEDYNNIVVCSPVEAVRQFVEKELDYKGLKK